MSFGITPNSTQSTNFPPRKVMEAGLHLGICYQIVDLGTHNVERQGETKTLRKIVLTFEFPNELIEIDGVEKPMALSRELTFSLNEKSTLYALIVSWFGKDVIKDGSLTSINDLLGKPAMVNVSNYTKQDGNQGAKVIGLNPIMKGMAVPETFNKIISLSLDSNEFDQFAFDELPNWVKEKIKLSPEYAKVVDEDLPF